METSVLSDRSFRVFLVPEGGVLRLQDTKDNAGLGETFDPIVQRTKNLRQVGNTRELYLRLKIYSVQTNV